MCIGIVLFCIGGLFIQTPHKELTTYSALDDEYSVIEEYVGGDAYNYIIGASLVGGEIAGAKSQKAIFISGGLLIFCLGLLSFGYITNEEKRINTIDEEEFHGEVLQESEEIADCDSVDEDKSDISTNKV